MRKVFGYGNMEAGKVIIYSGTIDKNVNQHSANGIASWKTIKVDNLMLSLDEFIPYEPAAYVHSSGWICFDDKNNEYFLDDTWLYEFLGIEFD
jgi:hypothetical protein